MRQPLIAPSRANGSGNSANGTTPTIRSPPGPVWHSLEKPAAMPQSAANTPEPRRLKAKGKQHEPESDEDPRQHRQHFVRDASLRKLRREWIRHAQHHSQTAEHQDALDPRHCRTQAGPKEHAKTCHGYEDAP
jgi:hypothetical protein